MWCLVISPFYDFAVFDVWLQMYGIYLYTVDKLQFLSFIFAVLLWLTVHFTALRLWRAIMRQHTKILLKSVQTFSEIWWFFSIFQMAIGHHVKFCLLTGSGGPRLVTVPNFVKILTIHCGDIDFYIFQNGRHCRLGFSKSWNFISWHSPEGIVASLCQISSKSVKTLCRCCYFLYFQDGGCHHLGLVWGIYERTMEHNWWLLSLCQICLWSMQ